MISARRRLASMALDYYPLNRLAEAGFGDPARLPITVKILLEGLLRQADTGRVSETSLRALTRWPEPPPAGAELPYLPSRVLLQDFTGVPAVLDLAAMRSAMQRAGKDAGRIDPLVQADLVIDHSVQVDAFGSLGSYARNIEREYERNSERYALLRWAQQAFHNFSVVPPGMGICHQVNLERLSRVVQVRNDATGSYALPDTLLGTDSHTTMVNGLGVLGWGVGGIEAEAALLGQPTYLPTPVVVGVRMSGSLRPGATATDLVLTLTEMLRAHGVVNKFVEFCGTGLSGLSVPDRATLSNMCPEYGATASLFPVDHQTLRYLETTGRDRQLIELVERYTREQGMFRTDDSATPIFDELLDLDLDAVEPSVAGPKRPQDRVPLPNVWQSFKTAFAMDERPGNNDVARFDSEGGVADAAGEHQHATAVIARPAQRVRNGSVVIAAITSCTNTSNPSVMVAAGLLAKRAVERGLRVSPTVKTSLAPGSRVVTDYLKAAGLMPYLEELGFYLVGYGCTTCIGNSGPLASAEVEAAVEKEKLNVVAVLSGNRNFEGRIHPLVRASYLASPPLVVAYALAGDIRRNLTTEPLGTDKDGKDVFLRELWPAAEEVNEAIRASLKVEMFTREYERIFDGDENWQRMSAPTGPIYDWDPKSTYVQEPPFFEGMRPVPSPLTDIVAARALVILGDSITTDHISPAGSIPPDSPAGRYLLEHGVERSEFNSYGARRGNHEVLVRGTFGNIRLRNQLTSREGYWTTHLPDAHEMTIFDASERYRAEGVPLIAIAGKEYGSGSSRDWAAKGPLLLGIRAVIAESFERIHRSNLVGMGILPLEFLRGESLRSLGLSGREAFTIRGLAAGLQPGQRIEVEAAGASGEAQRFSVVCRLDNQTDVEYLRHGGVLPMVLRQLMAPA
ncbi:MAG: aconitate hydratase AcnA [Candidatus Dormibacteraeota bacterium]|nr:aconitate hydratase AcnA [Candidatus Dormibacteraeota bacterium]